MTFPSDPAASADPSGPASPTPFVPRKECNKCHERKALGEFYKQKRGSRDGLMHACKECFKARVRENYQAAGGRPDYEKKREKRPARKAAKVGYQDDYRAKNPEKYRARNAVSNALRDGRLFRQPCKVCGTTVRVQAHHHDYSKPLDVEWLCFQHHREDEHGQTLRTPHLPPSDPVT